MGNPRSLKPRTNIARRLRRDATDVEAILWRALRERLSPHKFRRQHPIGKRIADFACPARKLVIELDGGQHDTLASADERRSNELAQYGYRVIRFWNNDVIENLDGVLEVISAELAATPTSPRPSPPQGGREGGESHSLSAPLGRRGLG